MVWGAASELGRGKKGFREVLRSHLRSTRRGRTGRSEERVQEALVLLLLGQVQKRIRACGGADPDAGSRESGRPVHARQGEVGSRLRREPFDLFAIAVRSARLRAA